VESIWTRYALIKEDMPFPSVTGRVCYHPCETACNRGQYDEAISIRAVERFLGDLGQALQRDVVETRETQRQESCRRGFGPRGATARRISLRGSATKLPSSRNSPKAGGLNRGGIPDWVLPQDAARSRGGTADRMGNRHQDEHRSRKRRFLGQPEKRYDAVVLAVGLTEPNSVRAEGENKQGVIYGLPFLRDIGMGTSKVKLGARVAVIGGGNTAIDCAREALRQGAAEVTMITVEANPKEMPCVPEDFHDRRKKAWS